MSYSPLHQTNVAVMFQTLYFRANTLLRLELVHKSDRTLVSLRDQRFQKTHIASGLEMCARVPDVRDQMSDAKGNLTSRCYAPQKSAEKLESTRLIQGYKWLFAQNSGGIPPPPPNDTHALGQVL